MLKDVTLGRYYSVDSIIHRIDPRTKIRFILLYILLILLDRNLPLYLVMTGLFILAVALSHVPFGYMLRGTRKIFVFVLIISAINMFTTMGDTVIKFGTLNITDRGLIKFGFVMWRMVLLILMGSMLMYTTKPTKLADGLEKCFHLSAGVAMGITIALRFISVLFEELDRIMVAQEARGVCFKEGGSIKRIKRYSALIIPLFQNSIDRAKNLGEALDARCYKGGKGRTKLEPLSYSHVDLFVYLILFAMVTGGVFLVIKY